VALHDSAIVAFAETKIVDRSERDIWELHAELMDELLQQSGVAKAEIDGLIVSASMTGTTTPFWAQCSAEMLGLELDFCEQVATGGCSPAGAVARAAMAIDAGLCNVVLLLNADTKCREDNYHDRSFMQEWVDPHGLMGPPGAFGLLYRRYDHQFGLDYEALGKLAVTQRNHALLNDNACEKLRQPITVKDYLTSRMISDPVRLLDCVMPCDGGNGLLMTSRQRAKSMELPEFVVPIGYSERTNHNALDPVADVTDTGHRIAGARALRQAGLKPADVKSLHLYDDFIFALLLQMEMLGFCDKGEGSAFVRATDFAFDGDLPLNTSGGQISAGQAGLAGGGTNLIEAVRQLFGKAGPRQVTDRSNALVTGIGWIGYARNWSTSAVLALTPDV
jgi:acetyl-CoA acetyltransferase